MLFNIKSKSKAACDDDIQNLNDDRIESNDRLQRSDDLDSSENANDVAMSDSEDKSAEASNGQMENEDDLSSDEPIDFESGSSESVDDEDYDAAVDADNLGQDKTRTPVDTASYDNIPDCYSASADACDPDGDINNESDDEIESGDDAATSNAPNENIEDDADSAEGIETEPAQEQHVTQEQYDKLMQEMKTLSKRHEMLQHDWANYKKRTAQELEEEKERACADLALDMFIIMDDLERAISHARSTDNTDIADGMMSIYKKTMGFFAKRGIKRLYPQNEQFDANQHNAIQQAKASELNVEPNTIVQVIQCGYMIGDKVVRPAAVIVAV